MKLTRRQLKHLIESSLISEAPGDDESIKLSMTRLNTVKANIKNLEAKIQNSYGDNNAINRASAKLSPLKKEKVEIEKTLKKEKAISLLRQQKGKLTTLKKGSEEHKKLEDEINKLEGKPSGSSKRKSQRRAKYKKMLANTKTAKGEALSKHIKGRKEGNKFRDWVNKNYPDQAKAKRSKQVAHPIKAGEKIKGLDLSKGSRNASYTNSYMRKAWTLLGDIYIKSKGGDVKQEDKPTAGKDEKTKSDSKPHMSGMSPGKQDKEDSKSKEQKSSSSDKKDQQKQATTSKATQGSDIEILKVDGKTGFTTKRSLEKALNKLQKNKKIELVGKPEVSELGNFEWIGRQKYRVVSEGLSRGSLYRQRYRRY